MCLHIFRHISVRLHMADAISEGSKQSGDPELACVEAQRSGREEGMCLHIPEVIPNSLHMADAISEGSKQSGDPELACVEARD